MNPDEMESTDELVEARRKLLAQLEEVDDTMDSEPEDDDISDEEMNEDDPKSGSSSNCSEADPDANSDDDEELDDLLEQGIASSGTETIWKTVLEENLESFFEDLPEGWRRITHRSGMPVFLHKPSRVVTFTRPYFIGTGSVRRHNIPLDSIPCLYQRKRMEKLSNARKRKLDTGEDHQDIQDAIPDSNVSLEKQEDYQLYPEEVTGYAEKLFKFKQIKIEVRRDGSVRHRKVDMDDVNQGQVLRKHGLTVDALDESNPVVVSNEGIRLLNIPTLDTRFQKRRYVINPTGKTSIALLHDYSQRVFRGRIHWITDEHRKPGPEMFTLVGALVIKTTIRAALLNTVNEKLALLNEKNPGVSGMVKIRDDEEVIFIGRATAPSKKLCKMIASKAALNVLIPDVAFNEDYTASIVSDAPAGKSYDLKAYEILDQLPVEDSRVFETCLKTSQLKPFRLLTEVCNKSIRFQGISIKHTHKYIGKQQMEVTISVGDFASTVMATSGPIGKEKAAQRILKQMHPELRSYGALLRLYSDVDEKEGRRIAAKNHNEVVRLQLGGSQTEPNRVVQQKLRQEMMKIPSPVCRRPAISAHFERVD